MNKKKSPNGSGCQTFNALQSLKQTDIPHKNNIVIFKTEVF